MLSIFALLYVVSMGLKFVVFLFYLWWRYKLYILSFKLPGPIQLPVLGNLQSIIFKKGSRFNNINNTILNNAETFRFWVGTKLLVFFRKPEDVEKILSSNLLLHGDDGGKANDEIWRLHKKIIKPLINVKFIIDNIATFEKHINHCLIKLQEHVETNEEFDIYNYIHPCTTDIIGDILLGENIDAQMGKNTEFLEANEKLFKYKNRKIFFSWFGFRLLYRCTKSYRRYKQARDTQRMFIEDVIRKSWERRKMDTFGENNTNGSIYKSNPIIDKIAEFIECNPKVMENEQFRDNLLNIFLESENGISIIVSFALYCFGMYPEYQRKVVNEIKTVLGENISGLKYEDIYKLKYLDMCVQDIMRLVPLKPFLLKNFTQDFEINNVRVPPECTVVIPTYVIHRDKNEYERPEHFHPDHFLPDNVKKRKIGSCLNFSMGPRDCLGKLLGTISVKLMLVHILQKYKIEAEGLFPDVELKMDVFTKPVNGFKLRIKKRIWEEC